MEELSYEELRRIQGRERNSQMLQELSEDFYARVDELISKKNRELKESFSLSEAKEFENVIKIVGEIYARREQKIALKAIRTARTGESVPGLAREERAMFDSMVKLLKENEDKFESLLKRKEEIKEDGKIKVKFLIDMPEFFGSDNKNYGPFKKGETATLPEKEAMLLLKRSSAEKV